MTNQPLNILVVDDEIRITSQLAHHLSKRGFNVFEANGSASAFKILASRSIDIVLLDFMLPGDMNGIQILKKIKQDYATAEVIMVSGQEDIDIVIDAQRQGVIDFVRKPFNISEIIFAIERTGKYLHLTNALKNAENHYSLISRELESSIEREFIGISAGIRKVTEMAMRVAADQDASVLITGENGTGKEVLARIIHYASNRKKKPFVPVNSTAIPETLIESEFFGHKKGAFTDAKEDKKGFFELANGGTLFLDEIADMPFSLQAKLLRAMEERRISPVGSGKEIVVDLRIISATNKLIEKLIEEQKFRLDLFHRINTFTLHIPPLRERPDDVEPLLRHFVEVLCSKKKRSIPEISSNVITHLKSYAFPGNVRELRNMAERALILSDGRQLTIDDFMIKNDTISKTESDTLNLDENEKMIIETALRQTAGNQIKAADLLGISRDSLKHRLQKHGIVISKTVE
ncbi:MAG: sigma-54-dependent Fis family transcriptional regulator [Sphingobacteriia bacterium]|nr:sigma-54-dependent Fis family transcriptional regulator [Sphingobacteriia bacterium]